VDRTLIRENLKRSVEERFVNLMKLQRFAEELHPEGRIMLSSDFAPQRVTRGYRQTIKAPPDVVFSLLCPVREAEWLEGWKYKMMYSESGRIEDGAVFSTPGDGEEDTIWVVTKHDTTLRQVEFARLTPNSRICLLRIAVHARDTNSSYVDIAYIYTGITPAGNRFLDHLTEDAFLQTVTFWEASMNHFLETGGRLQKKTG